MSNSVQILQLITCVDLLAVGLIIPLVPAHVRQMEGSHITVGALGSLYSGFQLFSGPLIGSISDIKGRNFILVLSLIVSGMSYVVMGVTTSITIILICRCVLGLFKQTQMLCRAMVPDYERNSEKQAEVYGKMAAISGLGITIGPLIGGHVADAFPENGFLVLSLIAGALFTVNAVLAKCLPKIEIPERRNPRKKSNQSVLYTAVNSLKLSVIKLYMIDWAKYGDIFLFKALIGFAMGVYYSNYSLLLSTEFDLSKKHIGYIISFQGVVGSLSSYFMGYINSFYSQDEYYVIRNFHVFVLITTSLIGLLISSNVYFYVFWLVPLAIGNAMGRLVTLEMLTKRVSYDERGSLIGTSNSVRSFAGVVSSMAAGLIGYYAGIEYVVYGALLPTALGLFISFRCLHNENRIKED